MTAPSPEQFLANLDRMKRATLEFIKNAEERGDTREAAEFHKRLGRFESIIEQCGGNPDV